MKSITALYYLNDFILFWVVFIRSITTASVVILNDKINVIMVMVSNNYSFS